MSDRLFSTLIAIGRQWGAVICLGLLCQFAQASGEDCGPVEEGMWGKYPVDYNAAMNDRFEKDTGAESKKTFFIQLIRGAEQLYLTEKVSDLSRLLLWVPNHPGGMSKMVAFAEHAPKGTLLGGYSIECWFDRAIRWVPNDIVMFKMRGKYRSDRGQYLAAAEDFERYAKLADDPPEMLYNIGLMYLRAGVYDKASKYAVDAYSTGTIPLTALKDGLKKVGKWVEPPKNEARLKIEAALAEMKKQLREEEKKPAGNGDASTTEAEEDGQPGMEELGQSAGSRGREIPPPPEGEDCGKKLKANPTMYGPFDYVMDKERLPTIEDFHYTYNIERAIGPPELVSFALRTVLYSFPNHHKALMSMMRFLGQFKDPDGNRTYGRYRSKYSLGSHYSMGCWLDRAVRWRPYDGVVRTIYGALFLAQKNYPEAVRQFKLAAALGANSPENTYNLGLAYFHMGDYKNAMIQAREAYSGGIEYPGLRDMLKRAGKWNMDDPGGGKKKK